MGWGLPEAEPSVWIGRSSWSVDESLGEALAGWLSRLDQATVLNRNNAHDVLRLTDRTGDYVLKWIKPTKRRRRSAISAFAKGWRLYERQPGAVPRPIGAIEWYRGYRVHTGLLVADYVAGEPLKAVLRSGRCSDELLRELGQFLARLHATGVVLKDAHKENIWVRDEPANGERFALLDLDALAWQHPGALERPKLLMKLGLPGWAHSVLAEAYWEAAGRSPSRPASWFLEHVYAPVKRTRGAARRAWRKRVKAR